MGKNYERTNFTHLLDDLHGSTARQLCERNELNPTVVAFGNNPIPTNSDLQYMKSLNVLNNMLIGDYDDNIDYGEHIEVIKDIFITIVGKDAAYWRTLESRLGCTDAKEKNRIINWLIELKNAWDAQDEEDFNFLADRLSGMSGFCRYVANYNYENAAVITESKKETEKLHRILSNEKIKYVYSQKTKIIHDKSCKFVKEMSDDELDGIETYVELYQQCPECAKKAYIRMGAKDIKEYDKYVKLYELMDVDLDILKRMYLELGFITKLSNMNVEGYKYNNMLNNAITVWYRDDTWRIGVTNKGMVRLEHNNYKQKGDCEREFTRGFHIQSDKTYSTRISNVIDCIDNYRYKAHIKKNNAEKNAVKKSSANKITVNNIAVNEKKMHSNAGIKNIVQAKMSYKGRLVEFICNLFKRDRIGHGYTNQTEPDANQICLYLYMDEHNKKCWMTGRYLAKKKEFSMFCQEMSINTPLQKVIKWVPVDQINAK